MNLESKTKLIQSWAGVAPDGDYGSVTADAIIRKAGIVVPPEPPPSSLKVCIDAGHGMANRKPGVYDPGCVDDGYDEAGITLTWAFELERSFAEHGVATFLTRRDQTTPCPVGTRDDAARAAGCTHLISIHVNDADSPLAHGTETLYRGGSYLAFTVQDALLEGLKLTNRGTKQRPDLAVLHFPKSCLIELGFIQSVTDRTAFLDPVKRKTTCDLIAKAVKENLNL